MKTKSFNELHHHEQLALVSVIRNLLAELQEHHLRRARDGLSLLRKQMTDSVEVDRSLSHLRESVAVLDEVSLMEEGLDAIQIFLDHWCAFDRAIFPLLPAKIEEQLQPKFWRF